MKEDLPVQVDGEPWMQPNSLLIIRPNPFSQVNDRMKNQICYTNIIRIYFLPASANLMGIAHVVVSLRWSAWFVFINKNKTIQIALYR